MGEILPNSTSETEKEILIQRKKEISSVAQLSPACYKTFVKQKEIVVWIVQ